MTRIMMKWLVAWFDADGYLRDAVERSLTGAPHKWAAARCGESETCEIFNISDPESEKKFRAMVDSRSKQA